MTFSDTWNPTCATSAKSFQTATSPCINRCIHLIVRPWEKMSTHLCLKGPEGTGKGSFVAKLLAVIGPVHSFQTANVDHVAGSFTGGIERAILLFLDEATY